VYRDWMGADWMAIPVTFLVVAALGALVDS
jgi:hypothetical protein